MVELNDFKPSLTPAVMAEFVGSFLLAFLAGAAAANAADNGLSAAALGVGLGVAMLTYTTVHISGGFLNPALTAGVLVLGGDKEVTIKDCISYIIAQFLGAILGSILVKSCLPVEALVHPFVTLGSLSDKHGEQVFIFEFMATLILGLVFMAVRDEKRSQAGNAGPLAIGFAYTIGMFATGPFTGGSMNPARTLGPALAFGNFHHIGVYMFATFLGGMAAAFLYKVALGDAEDGEPEEKRRADVQLAQKFV
mmetsp:Transcript_6022/g.12204  ORF Transcript_6022/g.12204 Transcript_6022/m.12204 type:complete len:251 (+) Transcript_6022:106-858(+)|eukprot:CAMPEP_0196739848 /NCGR_PEP_ID=MMETSP1091-20130531/26783_1 /TAXON_ID=302021 /ORGANISM="Rhodomonas sp., Strain CCMP768" /LENGTH=250 /DNA_ID=CAMNT_0042084657 /DNA_START=106 /DNA_END=858 /DNA_ORIENTATION=+